jgi:CRP-like cAMP-binding protein
MALTFNHLPDGRAAIQSHLGSLASLSHDERELLSTALADTTARHAGDEFIAADAPLDEPAFIVSGWACRAASLPDGRRQILDFYIPGDLAGYCSRPGARAKAAYVCLTNVVTVNAGQLLRLIREQPERCPGLIKALCAIEDEIDQRLLDQIVRTGRMQAHERMAHLISDLNVRHRRAGIGIGEGFVMPLTQETLGDALGLSTVHVNRVLQQLRREQTIRTGAGRIEISNAALLAAHSGLAH